MKKLLVRKALSLVLAITLLFSMSSVLTVFAVEDPTVTVGSVSAKQGETVDVDVIISGNPGVYSFVVSLSYDETRLKLTGVKNGSVLEGPQHNINNLAQNPYKLTFCNPLAAEDNTANGTIVTLSFEVLSDAAEGTAEISATMDEENTFNSNFEPCEFRVENGAVTVMHEHIAGEWETTLEPTCTAEGEKVQKCTICGEILNTKVITALGHDFYEPYIRTPATCTTDGEVYRTCSVCNEEETKVIPATGHNFGEWQISTPATCTTDGEETRTCSNCGEEETKVIPATEHVWGEWKIKTQPTETSDGVKHRICSVCGEEETRPYKFKYLLGDANEDGIVSIDDATEIQKYLAKMVPYLEAAACDVDGDGTIAIGDATEIQKYLAVIITKFPAEKE
ncbi:MAG: dockerin type I domain-containing protein [Oscillospiraceae bacterium]|jgi:hypothetical protein|nr:dockerin type I domain-containing protein [Oscillospiraceae bacterium]